jgi:hypothetical protein
MAIKYGNIAGQEKYKKKEELKEKKGNKKKNQGYK